MPKQTPAREYGRMRRLPPEWYRGHAFVHWSMTIDGRKTGWLDRDFYHRFREIQLHTLSRYHLVCLAHCLMPDHLHGLWAGLASDSDQSKAATFFRKFMTIALKTHGLALQKQPWDEVLREKDLERDAVVRAAFYIAQNPVRAGLVQKAEDWPYSGSQAAGYPDLDWRYQDFEQRIWTIYDLEVRRFEQMTRG